MPEIATLGLDLSSHQLEYRITEYNVYQNLHNLL